MRNVAPRWSHRRAIRDGLIVAGVIFNLTVLIAWGPRLDLWIDVHAWQQLDLSDLYRGTGSTIDRIGVFRYSPLIAWIMAPLASLTWPTLVAVWTTINLAAVALLGKRDTVLLLIAFPPVLLELINGNIAILMAVAIWAGLRWPASWAFIFLTKVTPAVGVLWFAGRRQWRNLAIAFGVPIALAMIGVLIAPDLWAAWVRSLTTSNSLLPLTGTVPLVFRVAIAAAVAYVAGRTDRAWLVPIAALVAMPVIWIQSTAILTACFPLWADRRRWDRAGDSRPDPAAVIPPAVP